MSEITVDCSEGTVCSKKKAKIFDIPTFRSHLHSTNNVKLLREFANIAETRSEEQDVVTEYLDSGGSVKEILTILDVTAEADLVIALPVFKVVYVLLIKIQRGESKHITEAREAIQYLMTTFVPTIRAMITINSPKHRKTVFRLLAAIITFHKNFGLDMLQWFSLTPPQLEELTVIGPTRKSFVMFLVAFFVEGYVPLMRQVVEKKDLLSSIVPGLIYDDAETVAVVLSVFKEKFLQNSGVPKTLKLKLFNTQVVQNIFKLYFWKGPRGAKFDASFTSKKMKRKEFVVNEDEKNLVLNALQEFLLTLCTSRKSGVAFADKTFGFFGKVQNRLLLTGLEEIDKPWENERLCELFVEILAACPDLIKPVLGRMEASFHPRKSSQWNQALNFVIKVIQRQKPNSILSIAVENLSLNHVQGLIRNLCLPSTVLEHVRFQDDLPLEVKRGFYLFLTTAAKKLKEYFCWFEENRNTDQKQFKNTKNYINRALSTHLPTTEEIINLWNQAIVTDEAYPENIHLNEEILNIILDFTLSIANLEPELFYTSKTLCESLIERLDVLKESQAVQKKILQLTILTDSALLSPQSKFFNSSINLLMHLCQSNEDLVSLVQVLQNTGIFRDGLQEINCWLYGCLKVPDSHKCFISELFARTISDSSICNTSIESELTSEKMISMFKDWKREKSLDGVKVKSPGTSLILFEDLLIKLKENWQKYKSIEKKSASDFVNRIAIQILHSSFDDERFLNLINPSLSCYHKILEENLGRYLNEDYDLNLFCENERKILKWIVDGKACDLNEDLNYLEWTALFNLTLYHFYRSFVQSNKDTGKRCAIILKQIIETNDMNCAKSFLISIFGSEKLRACVTKKNTILKPLSQVIKAFNNKTSAQWTKETSLKLWRSNFVDYLCTVPRIKLEIVKPWLDLLKIEEHHVIRILDAFLKNPEVFKNADLSEIFYFLLNLFPHNAQFNKNKLSEKFLEHCVKLDPKNLNIYHVKCLNVILNVSSHVIRHVPLEWFYNILSEVADPELQSALIDCGNLLLSCPQHVETFVKRIPIEAELGILMALLDTLIKNDQEWSDFDECHENHQRLLYWTVSDLKLLVLKEHPKGNNKRLELGIIFLNQLKLFYETFRKSFLNFYVKSKNEKLFLKHEKVTKFFLDLFLDDKDVQYARNKLKKCNIHPLAVACLLKKVDPSIDDQLWKTCFEKLFSNAIDCNWPLHVDVFSRIDENNKESSIWKDLLNSKKFEEFYEETLRNLQNYDRLGLLTSLIKAVKIQEKDEKSLKTLKTIFDMCVAHSDFLKVLLGNSAEKRQLVELLLQILLRSADLIKESFVPILLSSYAATLSRCDQRILRILRLAEERGVDFKKFEPFFWGEAAVSHYSVRGNVGLSLWRQANMKNVLEHLDTSRVMATLSRYPITRSLKDEEFEELTEIYDPSFLLPLFARLLSPGALAYCQSFIHQGGLSIALMALSSLDTNMRGLATVILSRLYSHLQLIQHSKQRPIWLHFIDCVRFGLADIKKQPLPSLLTLFLARMVLELANPDSALYQALQKYLLAKPVFYFNSVPEFLPLFYSSDVLNEKHQLWILEVLRDGVRSEIDANLIVKGPAFKVILCYFSSSVSTRELRVVILQILTNMLKTPVAIDLIAKHGLLSWIWNTAPKFYEECLSEYITLMAQIISVLKNSQGEDLQNFVLQSFNILSSNLLKFLNKSVAKSYVELFLTTFECNVLMLTKTCTIKFRKDIYEQLVTLCDGNVVFDEVFMHHMVKSPVIRSIFTYKHCTKL